jgi:hypothetical protein
MKSSDVGFTQTREWGLETLDALLEYVIEVEVHSDLCSVMDETLQLKAGEIAG